MTSNKDIIVFPKIDNSYVIKTDSSRINMTPLNEWVIFGWKGYRIGSYYENYDGGGFLYVVTSVLNGEHFDDSKKHTMRNMKSAVTYAWLRAMQRLTQNHFFDKKQLKQKGQVANKYGIRAFSRGPNEKSIFSLFDSKGRLIGSIERTGIDLVGFMVTDGKNEVITYQNKNETSEKMLRRLMYVLRRNKY